MTEPPYVAQPDPPIDLSKLPLSGDWNTYAEIFAKSKPRVVARNAAGFPTLIALEPVPAMAVCPRLNFNASGHPKCFKPLKDHV